MAATGSVSLRIARWVCSGVIVASVLACVAMAFARSEAIVAVTVTEVEPSTGASTQPTFVRAVLRKVMDQAQSPPNLELLVIRAKDGPIRLGTKLSQSAKGGLVWRLSEPVSASKVVGLRLVDEGRVLDTPLAEVPATDATATANGYRFEIVKERSFAAGVRAFFDTPIGLAIACGFAVAALILIVSAFS